MENIFIKKNAVISSFIIPWILGIGCKTQEQAKKYIKYGETLNPLYYKRNQDDIKANDEEIVYLRFMEMLFNENNVDQHLTELVGEKVYKPWDCLSGIYQIEINPTMGLVARPQGVTMNNSTLVMVDTYIKYMNATTEKELKIKLLATMAVWRAKHGIVIIQNMMNHIIRLDFNEVEWNILLEKIKVWADSTL